MSKAYHTHTTSQEAGFIPPQGENMVARKKKVVRKSAKTKVARGRAKAKAKAAVISRKPRRKAATRKTATANSRMKVARKPVKLPRSLNNVAGSVEGNAATGSLWVRTSANISTKLGRAQARKMLARAEDFIKYFESK